VARVLDVEDMRVRDLMTSPVSTVQASQSLPLAASIMELERIRHLPVIDDEGHVVGLVTHRDLLAAQISALRPLSPEERASLQLSVRVSQVMRKEVWTIASDARVATAARLLRDHRFGCLPVVDDTKLVGIVTESDLLALVVDGVDLTLGARPMKVENAMTLFPITISPTTSIADARLTMTKYHVRHLPVLDGLRPVAIVTERDLAIAEAIYQARNDASAKVAVALVGSEKMYEVAPGALLDGVLLEMSALGIGAAMVVDGRHLVGVLTTTDVCRLFGKSLRAMSAAAEPTHRSL
jgi:CBS domain-containing membrane protein